ncbi:hypothetical protein E2C01_044124 [Portunus trituberculatus]|uniref:Uncharacterized protein n=1 Tax=Portunus trituberculatus TaxID=210409 RepID=A0A5B7FR90_PORTR|nr:hypothetical protein [Portunus trituberculatus]
MEVHPEGQKSDVACTAVCVEEQHHNITHRPNHRETPSSTNCVKLPGVSIHQPCSITEVVYQYNTLPRNESLCSTPAATLYRYEVRVKDVGSSAVLTEQEAHSRYSVDDNVWVKPPQARCDTE